MDIDLIDIEEFYAKKAKEIGLNSLTLNQKIKILVEDLYPPPVGEVKFSFKDGTELNEHMTLMVLEDMYARKVLVMNDILTKEFL